MALLILISALTATNCAGPTTGGATRCGLGQGRHTYTSRRQGPNL